MGKWWGEGDEKVWVDGESFPSHFGTGTEDHYGYAWATRVFQGPFCNEPRAGPATRGITPTPARRSLDAIPFTVVKVRHGGLALGELQGVLQRGELLVGAPGVTHNREPQAESAKGKVEGKQ